MLAMCAVATAEAPIFAGGAGTEDDPWQIATAEQLMALSATVNDGSAQGYPGQYFALTEDIDLKGVEWQPIGHMDLEDMSNYNCMFFGTFDGQGHTISNVTFSSDYPVCGVGVIGMNLGEVKNLTVENVQIHCTDTYSMAIGGIVGYNTGAVHDVILTGTNDIAGVNATGGICGGIVAVLNFFLMGVTVQKVTDLENEADARNMMKASYSRRMMMQGVWVVLAILLPCFQFAAGLIPLLFPGIGIKIANLAGVNE